MSAVRGLEVVDAHHHLWDLTASYPWLQGPPATERFTGDDSAIRRDYGVADYLADVDDLTLLASVHVDAGAGDGLAEARWVQELHDRHDLPTVAVAGVDLADPFSPAVLEELADLPCVRGVRHILNHHPDPGWTYTDRSDLMSDPVWLANYARLADLGLSFDLQVYPHQLAEAAQLAGDHPETLVVLNHAGMPTSRDPEHLALWRSGLADLAARPNTAVKVSGVGMVDHAWTTASLRPVVTGVLDAFGPARTAFASNFPVDSLYSGLTDVYAAFAAVTADLSPAEQRDLFVDTAVRTYRIAQPTTLDPSTTTEAQS